jgi:DNA-binding MarR family transcriptional regulator/N-acetylglutamate synthase-like GNAT family acetyltransferase
MNFYSKAGQMALGSRLRQLGDTLMADANKIYKVYGVEIDPRWFPVFYMLTVKENSAITELAEDIGQTHPAVSQVVRSMVMKDIVTTQKGSDDARINRVALTQKGKAIAARLTPQCEDVNTAISHIFSATGSNLWSELDAIEHELKEKTLYERVIDARKTRERSRVEVVAYRPKYKSAFRDLNIAWIEKHWEMEPSDHKALDKPTENIINKGGYIAIALHETRPVGTCALMKMENNNFELAKMAVADEVKGMGIGSALGEHIIAKAQELGAERIYLESNTVLAPAVNLYRKLGFQRVSGIDSPYARCNIQMALHLKQPSASPQ